MSADKRKDKITVEQAGRMGGEKTAETHSPEFYSEIGHKGGESHSSKSKAAGIKGSSVRQVRSQSSRRNKLANTNT